MTKLRVGVLGCASIARRKMLPALVADPSVDLVAVASRTADRAAEFAALFGCAGVTGYDELLARSDIDAVYIPLPAGLHAEWVRAALEAGKHVLVEKPAVTSSADAVALVELAAKRDLLLMESFMFLYHGQHAAVADLVASGAIGETRAFTSDFGIPPLPAGDIRNDAALGGSALADVGVYPLRAAQLFLGPDLEVVGATSTVDPALGVDVAGAVLLRNPAGVTAQLSYGFTHMYRSMYALWGGTGRLELHRAFTPPDSWQPVLRIERQSVVEERTLPADSQFPNVVRAFTAAIQDRAAAQAHGADLVRQAALVDAVRAASAGA
ncbi:Gfo/Idh/MocA family oxidoreductase [Actinoplanes sp. NPDC049548]|uniref:Gfo/Idh/MocA family protein n=1 Tax=Actinoplanes sp. NPDC049548 TaxID=3155152 RepID=UPI00342D30D1